MSKSPMNFQLRRSTRTRVPVIKQPTDFISDKAKKSQVAAELDVSLDLSKDSSDESLDPDISSPITKRRIDNPKKLGVSKLNVCGTSPPLPPPDDSSTPKEPSSNQLKEIEMDTKRISPKKRRVRKKITLFAQTTPTSTSQPQEQETSTVSKEKVEVIECSNTGELPSVDEPSEPANAVSEVVIDSDKETGVKELASIKEKSAQNSTIANDFTVKEKEISLSDSSVEDPTVDESSIEEPSVDNPSLEGPSVELPCVEEPLMEEYYDSQDRDSDSTPCEDNEDVEEASMDDSMITNVGKSSNRRSKPVRRSYEKVDKKKVVAEVQVWGINPIALRHNVHSTTLRFWVKQELGYVPENKEWGVRSNLGEDALKDWVVQKMALKERVSHEELRENAMKFIQPHNPKFYASNRWIIRFLNQHEIDVKAMTVHGKDATIKHFSSPSKKQTIPNSTPRAKPKSTPKEDVSDTVTTASAPSKKQTIPKSSPRSKPKSTPKEDASDTVTTPLGKRKSASLTPPSSKRKQPKREKPKKANLSIFDFDD